MTSLTLRRRPHITYRVAFLNGHAEIDDDARRAWAFARSENAWPQYRTRTDPTWRDMPLPEHPLDQEEFLDDGPLCNDWPVCRRCLCTGWLAHHAPFWLFRPLLSLHQRWACHRH